MSINKFSAILEDRERPQYTGHMWEMLQKWLGTMSYYTDNILRLSKIWPDTDEPERIIEEIKRKRPRRLMTPSMVWTCMSVLHEEKKSMPIMTLGGADEQGLWEAWRICCDIPSLYVGHIYVSKLTERNDSTKGEKAIHLADKPLHWQSPEDIETEFGIALSEEDSSETWSNVQSMIPWSINNCILLPNFIS
ncbi:MAG: hypothetical protein JRJ85_21990, partial [Deltaproteobacteria bacterium]|nr:hypothetical protein [Deltaproteobacteria bacterium]